MRSLIKVTLVLCLFQWIISAIPSVDVYVETIENLQENLNEAEVQTEENLDETRNFLALKRQAVVKLPKYGILKGSISMTAWTNRVTYQFLGVRYAEAPTGSKRFKAPVPVRPWRGVRSAEKFGRKCPVLGDLAELSESERKSEDLEDCLNLSIYSTNLNASFPVMFYVHGGSFFLHNANEYPPNYILERDVILVVVQYRLDALGFLSTNTNEIPGNAGLLDTLQALSFVKENIAYFGGDPNRITIFGQSSGAAMVSALVISPNVPDNLFDRAIIQSGSAFATWTCSDDPVNDARDIAAYAGLNRNQSLTLLNRAFITMDVFDLLKAVDQYHTIGLMNGRWGLGARSMTVGGPTNLLPDMPGNLVKAGKYNKNISLIVGTTRDDGTYVATVAFDVLAAQAKLTDKHFMMHELVESLIHLVRIDNDGGTVQALAYSAYWLKEQLLSGDFGVLSAGIVDLLGTLAFKAPALKLAQLNAKLNPCKTFLYSFDYAGAFTRFGYGGNTSHYPFKGGVHHSDDLIYLFPFPLNIADLNEADRGMAQILLDLWTSFAEDGTPRATIDVGDSTTIMTWPSLSSVVGPYLHINQTLTLGENYVDEFTVETRQPSNVRKFR